MRGTTSTQQCISNAAAGLHSSQLLPSVRPAGRSHTARSYAALEATAACLGSQQQGVARLHRTCQQQQWQQQRRAQVVCAAAAAEEERVVSYDWSWQQKGRSMLPEAGSAFDERHPLPEQLTLQAAVELLSAAAAAAEAAQAELEQAAADDAQQAAANTAAAAAHEAAAEANSARCTLLPSQSWLQQLLAAAQPLLTQPPVSPSGIVEVLQLLSRLEYTPDTALMAALLSAACSRLQDLSTQQLAGLVWSLSNLQHVPTQQHWQALLSAAQGRLEEFYGPDLALLVCGAGSILSSTSSSFDPEGGVRLQQAAGGAGAVAAAEGSVTAQAPSSSSSSSSEQLSLPSGWADAVLAEVQYQITEFPADLGAFDLARMASGLADLGISPSTQLQDRLLKAVYMRTRTIEEKGAVDFALAKLDSKGKKSMHYDPRWTHEELKWLPRRERDKRRILKEGWYRTQWTGWKKPS